MRFPGLLLTSALFSLSYTAGAHAYLDPGTGSILLQGLLAVIAGAAITIRMYWDKLRSFFGRKKVTPEASED